MKTPGRWLIDTSEWPIVVHAVEGTLTDKQLDEYLKAASSLMEREGDYFAVMDASHIGSVSASMRSRIAAWQRQYRPVVEKRCRGVVYVLATPLLRFIHMTILLVTGLAVPYVVCSTRDEGLRWARERLGEHS